MRGRRRVGGVRNIRAHWLAAATVALLACLAFVAQLAHLTVIKHAVCAQHGQMVHVAPGEPSIAPSATDASGDPAAFAGDGQAHFHGHCSAVAQSEALLAGPPPAPLTVLSWALFAPSAPVALALPSSDLLHLAPKTSPPA